MPREKEGYESISARITQEDAERLRRAARELDRPVSSVLRLAVRFYLDAVDRERDDA